MRYASENDRASELVLQVVSVQRIAHGTTSIWLRPDDEGRCIRATPGQFAHIAVEGDRKSTRLNSSHNHRYRMPSSA